MSAVDRRAAARGHGMRRLNGFIVASVVGTAFLVFILVYIGMSLAYTHAMTRLSTQAAVEVAEGASAGLYELMKTGAALPRLVEEYEATYADVLGGGGYDVRFRRLLEASTFSEQRSANRPTVEPEVLEVARSGQTTVGQVGQVTRVMIPLRATQQCLTCHSSLKVGQSVGIVDVQHNMTRHTEAARNGVYLLLLVLIPVPFLAAAVGTKVLADRIQRSMTLVNYHFLRFLKTESAEPHAGKNVPPLEDLGFVEFNALFKSLTARLQQDATEQRDLRERLREAQKMEAVGGGAGGIGRDLDHLLPPILSHTRLVLDALPEDSPFRTDLADVCRAGERALSLAKRLPAFGGKRVPPPAPLSLNRAVVGLERTLRPLVGDAIQLVFHLSAAVDSVKIDVGQIEQAITSLVINAADAMPEGGTVTIETTNTPPGEELTRTYPEIVPGDYVRLAVTDTGTGMDAETLSHMFEPFFTTKEPGKNAGLGLATVYGIVRQSGGYVFGDSRLGHGSTFTVWLPLAPE
jgi:signal transduction histidine kinase